MLTAQVSLLLAALDLAAPPRGSHPRFPGPGRQERVCVVGAGPAGIHMALSLKRLGYQNVVVLEKEGRVGGKCLDVFYRGTHWPLGAGVVGSNTYNRNLIPLAAELGLANLTNIAGGTTRGGERVDPLQIKSLGLFALLRYVTLHRQLLGIYEGDLPPRPSPIVLYRLRGSFGDFLRREGLEVLRDLFHSAQTMWGYGFMDEVSALYSLFWITPELILPGIFTELGTEWGGNLPNLGIEIIWRTVVERERLDVRLNVQIERIHRIDWRNFVVHQFQDSVASKVHCNFIIWTPEMSGLPNILSQASRQELHLFQSLTTEVYTAHLINLRGETSKAIYTAYLDNMDRAVEHGVVLEIDIVGLKNLAKPNDLREVEGLRSMWVGQMGRNETSVRSLRRLLTAHYRNQYPKASSEVLLTKSWTNYFPR